MLCHHCANEPHTNPQHFSVAPYVSSFSHGAQQPRTMLAHLIQHFWDTLHCPGSSMRYSAAKVSILIYRQAVCLWLPCGEDWRGQTAPISLSPRAFVVCPQVLPTLQSITTATATRFPSNQPFTFWLASENLQPICNMSSQPPLAFSLT